MLSEYERGFNSGAESTERACHEQMNRERESWSKHNAARDLALCRAVMDWAWDRFPRYDSSEDAYVAIIAKVDASLAAQVSLGCAGRFADGLVTPPVSAQSAEPPSDPYGVLPANSPWRIMGERVRRAEQQRAAGIMRACFSHWAPVSKPGTNAYDQMLAYIAEADAAKGKGEK